MSDNMNNSLKQTTSAESVNDYPENIQQPSNEQMKSVFEKTIETNQVLIDTITEWREEQKKGEIRQGRIERELEIIKKIVFVFVVIVIAMILAFFLYIMTNGKVI